MEFYFGTKTEDIVKLEERLQQMTLAYKMMSLQEEDQPYFKDGSKTYIGVDKMNDYLDLLDSEKEQWYYCNC